MTILAEMTGWSSIITNVLLVVHVVVCVLLCLVVLMQRPKQEGLGAAFGGGMTDQAFGARTTDVLQKGTVYLASLLFIITLTLSILVSAKSKAASISTDNESNNEAALEDFGAAAVAAAAEEGDDLTATVKALTDEIEAGKKEDKVEEDTPEVVHPAESTVPAKPADSSNTGQ